MVDLPAIVSAMFAGMSQAQCARHGLAAAASAVLRTCADIEANSSPQDDHQDEKRARIAAIEPVVSEYVDAAAEGRPPRVAGHTRLRRNVAEHNFGTCFSSVMDDIPAMKRIQRGGVNKRFPPPAPDFVLEIAPFSASEIRVSEDVDDDADTSLGSIAEKYVAKADIEEIAAMSAACERRHAENEATMPGETASLFTNYVKMDQLETLLANSYSQFTQMMKESTESMIHNSVVPIIVSHTAGSQKEMQAHATKFEASLAEVKRDHAVKTLAPLSLLETLRSRVESLEKDLNGAHRPCREFAPSVIQCKFFTRGQCNKGAACQFSHQSPNWSEEDPRIEGKEADEPSDSDDAFHDAGDQTDWPVEPPPLSPNIVDGGEDRILGMPVRTLGLSSPEFNDRFGSVLEYLPSSGRYRVQLDPKTIRAFKRVNLQFPARCPRCESEVTGSQCFSCGCGE